MAALGKSELHLLLEAQIRREGPLRFDSFMRQCLYTPGLGYYEQARTIPGRKGDFITSVSIGAIFGMLLGDYAHHVWTVLGKPDIWHICEQGAHHGHLARDILERLQERWPEAYAALRFRLIEPSPVRRGAQRETLRAYEKKIEWLPDETSLKARSWNGFFYSNELPDSFPIRRLMFDSGSWKEFWVDCADDRFMWTLRPVLDAELMERLDSPSMPRLPGYIVEWRPEAARWMDHVAQSVRAGAVLTIDYGWPAHELFRPERGQGSLTCFSAHRKSADPLSNPGGQDLTAQVNFTELEETGKKGGLETIEFTDQHRFLTRLASIALLPELEKGGSSAVGRLRQFAALTRPELMGASFKVLLQARGGKDRLSAFRI